MAPPPGTTVPYAPTMTAPPAAPGGPLGAPPSGPGRVIPFRTKNAQIVRPLSNVAVDPWDAHMATVPEISPQRAAEMGLRYDALVPDEEAVKEVTERRPDQGPTEQARNAGWRSDDSMFGGTPLVKEVGWLGGSGGGGGGGGGS